jgi:hypothetical protein
MILRKITLFTVCALALSCLAQGTSPKSAFKFKPLVRTGDVAPVPPQLSSILEFSFNDQGQIALIGDGGLVLQSSSQTIPIAATGDTAPGGGLFFSVDVPSVSPQGQVFFRGNVAFPGTSGLYSFSNGTISLVIPDGTLASDGTPVTPSGTAFTSGGDMMVADEFSGALFLFSNGTLNRLVGPGDRAPGGGTFSTLVGAAINQSHQVAFQAFTTTGADGIFLLSAGTITKIVASGDIMPDGVPFGFPDEPTINDSGQVVFGGISNSIADSGIFSFLNGQLSVIIPRLAPLPNGSFFNSPFTTSLNNAGQIAISLLDTSGAQGVYLFADGQLSQIEAAGQPAPEGGVFASTTEVGATINNAGQVLLFAGRAQHGNAAYLFSGNQLSRVLGQGDTIPRQPKFEFPEVMAIGGGDLVLISDSTFPGGNGAYTANANGQANVAIHQGEALGADGIVNFLFGAAMNQSGQVAASIASSDANGTVTLESANTLTVLNDSSSLSAVHPGAGPVAIDDLGEVAFAGFNPSTFSNGIFLTANGQTQLLLDEGAQLPQGTDLTNLAVNNLHALAFEATTFFPSFTTNVDLFANGQLTTIAASGSPAPGGGTFQIVFFSPRVGPVMNNRGDVAFAGGLSGVAGGFFGASGIFLYRNGTLTRVVGPGDPSPDGGIFQFADAPSINANGDISFFAETSNFSFGAFVFHQGHFIQVAVAGDIVDGIPLGFVDQPQLNNNGDVAFTASLFDGSNAIFVATSGNSAGAGFGSSTPGAPPAPGQVQWQKMKRNLLQSKDKHNHLGQNVKMVNQSN